MTLSRFAWVGAVLGLAVLVSAARSDKSAEKLEVQRRKDISQLQAALSRLKTDFGFGQQFPSRLVLREDGNYDLSDQVEADSAALLMKMFRLTGLNQLKGPDGKGLDWNGNGKIDSVTTLYGDQCLVFFLGGIIPANAKPVRATGFSTVPGHPTAVGGNRGGPFFEFDAKRLRKGSNGFFSYLDPTGMPYLYFSSYKRLNGYNRYGSSDCPAYKVSPYLKTVAPATTYWNEGSFQIISAGPDKKFGPGGILWGMKHPATDAGTDDLSNFAEGVLGAGK